MTIAIVLGIASALTLPPPAFRERCHRLLARRRLGPAASSAPAACIARLSRRSASTLTHRISVMRAACRSIANPATRSVSIQAGTCNHVDMFNALWQKWLSRISGSPKNIALGQLVLAILLSFVSGMFLIQGMGVFRGDMFSWIQLIASPAMLGIAIVHARLVWQAIE